MDMALLNINEKCYLIQNIFIFCTCWVFPNLLLIQFKLFDLFPILILVKNFEWLKKEHHLIKGIYDKILPRLFKKTLLRRLRKDNIDGQFIKWNGWSFLESLSSNKHSIHWSPMFLHHEKPLAATQFFSNYDPGN